MEIKSTPILKQFPDYKCLRRSIRLKEENQSVLAKIKLKKLYFKMANFEMTGNKLKYLLKGKQAFCLKHMRLKIEDKDSCLVMLKYARNLTSLGVSSQSRINVWNLVSCIRRLSKNIQEIYLTAKLKQVKVSETTPLYRHLSTLRHLKSVRREIPHLGLEFENVEKEHEIRHRYLSKLKKLEQFFPTSQLYLKKALKDDKVFPYLKVLVLDFSDVTVVQGNDLMALLNELQRKMNGIYDKEELQKDIDETAPLFKFDHYPNLREVILNFGEGTLRLVKPYIVNSFRTFGDIKVFRSKIACKSHESSQPIFNALVQLPLLVNFDLEFYPWEKVNPKQLVKCLESQTELVSLSISFPGFRESVSEYEKQNKFLKNIHKCLNDKPNLKDLTLDFNHGNLESLSEGLRKTELMSQLQELTIYVFDDHFNTETAPLDRVKGLLDFLIIHKRTLRNLTIHLLFACEDEVLDALIKTISELKELKALHLKVNDRNEDFTGEYLNLYSGAPAKLTNKHLSLKQTFSCLDQTLKNLTKMTELTIEIYLIGRAKTTYSRSSINSSIVFNALPSLKCLRWFLLSLPFLKKALKKHPAQISILPELTTVKGMGIQDTQLAEMEVEELKEVITQFNKKQSLRCELMF